MAVSESHNSFTSSGGPGRDNAIENICLERPQPFKSVDSLSLLQSLRSDSRFSETQASAILFTLNEILSARFSGVISTLTSRQKVETDSHMLKARCHEIKLDLQTLSNKNALARKAIHEKSLDEVQKTLEKLRDSVHQLQAESKLRLNVFKSENREENSKIDSLIHQKTGQLTLSMSDIKTNVEAIKVRLMFSFTSFIIVAFFFLIMEKNLKKQGTAK